MKITKNIWVFLCLTLLIANTLSAQNAELIETLNIEQIKLLDNSSKIMKENRKEFQLLLSKEQKALLRNETIARKERMLQLKSTLSLDQLRVFEANRAEDKASRRAFRRSLTPEQHLILKTARQKGTSRPRTRKEKDLLNEKIILRKKELGAY